MFGRLVMNEKADLFKRIVAVVIDGIIASIISAVIPIVGGIIGGAYFLVRDGMKIEALGYQSIGKKIMQLKVIGPNEPIDYITSIKRNIPISFVFLLTPFLIIPLIGLIIMLIAGLAQFVIGLIEIYKVFTDPEGKRMGDTIAETQVIEV